MTSVKLHPYLPIPVTSLYRPLPSNSKVAVVERFHCNFAFFCMFPSKRLCGGTGRPHLYYLHLDNGKERLYMIRNIFMPNFSAFINPEFGKHLQKIQQVTTDFFCRKMVDERTRQISEKSAEKARQESERMDSKKQSSERICQKERERQEKAETWKHSRIEAMRERRTQHQEMENSYERAAQEQESQRLVRVP